MHSVSALLARGAPGADSLSGSLALVVTVATHRHHDPRSIRIGSCVAVSSRAVARIEEWLSGLLKTPANNRRATRSDRPQNRAAD